MADRYWVGGSGNWNDTGHWSTSSGGSSGASYPILTDNVIVDALSGLSNGIITININPASCYDFSSITGFNYKINSSGGSRVFHVYGSEILEAGLTFTGAGGESYPVWTSFDATTTGHTITSNGCDLYDVEFNGIGGEWTLQDDMYLSLSVVVSNGTFYANNHNLKAMTFSFYSLVVQPTNIYMGSGTWECIHTDFINNDYSPWVIRQNDNHSVNFYPNTATIKISDT